MTENITYPHTQVAIRKYYSGMHTSYLQTYVIQWAPPDAAMGGGTQVNKSPVLDTRWQGGGRGRSQV